MNSSFSFYFFLLMTVIFFIPPQSSGQDNDISFYLDAVGKIKEKSLYLKPNTRHEEIVRETIRSYLKSTDPFSDYLDPDEYSAFKATQHSNYIGIGMDIEKNSSGRIICFPYPDSSAEKSGIKTGDILESIEGISVSQLSVFTVTAKARGRKGSEMLLTVLKKDGNRKQIRVKRTAMKTDSISKMQLANIPVIKIMIFAISTKRELEHALEDLNNTEPIIFDIRGNPGGDLHSAIDSAMLFLQQGKKIVGIRNRKGLVKSYESTTAGLNLTSPVYLWQDEQTASAAEVFIAALTQNNRAKSIGKKTFGKGTKQDVVELNDGSAMILTTGFLQTPNGMVYHEKGIEPAYPLSEIFPEIYHYLIKTKELIGQQSSHRFLSADTYLICFDKDFEKEEDAENWSLSIRQYMNKSSVLYPLIRRKPDSIKSVFMVCLGLFGTREEAEKERIRISDIMNIPMFIETIKP